MWRLYLLNGYTDFYQIWSVWCRANPEAICWRWLWLVNVGMPFYNKSKLPHIQPFAPPVHFPLQRIPRLRRWLVSSLLPRARHPLGPTSVGSAVRGVWVARGAWPPFITACRSSYFCSPESLWKHNWKSLKKQTIQWCKRLFISWATDFVVHLTLNYHG